MQEKSKKKKRVKVIKVICELTVVAKLPEAVPSVLPVSDADGGIHGKESQELFIQHLVDAAFPGQKQLGEATETGVCNSGCVGDSHW